MSTTATQQDNFIDNANINTATAESLATGQMPPLPTIDGLQWQPSSQTTPVVQGTTADRLNLLANADSQDYTQYVPDIVGATLLNYWDGGPPAQYTLTMRSYWRLIPSSYTQVPVGSGFQKAYTTTYGIQTTDASTLSAELGVDVGELSAKISTEYSHSVTTSTTQQESTTYNVGAPAAGFTRVWMLWQLIDEVIALDSNGNLIANPTRQGDVEWDGHNASGAYLNYPNLHQLFPADIIVPVQQDFPS